MALVLVGGSLLLWLNISSSTIGNLSAGENVSQLTDKISSAMSRISCETAVVILQLYDNCL
jgi:hypothetical protein